jgi:hypothetical protein
MREGQKARQGTQKGCKNFCFLTKPTTIHAASEINVPDNFLHFDLTIGCAMVMVSFLICEDMENLPTMIQTHINSQVNTATNIRCI